MTHRNDARTAQSRRPAWAAPWPDATTRAATAPVATPTDRRRARLVTYGLLLTLLFTAAAEAELWPFTAYRLFSEVRTGTTVSLDLVAATAEGDVVVQPGDRAAPLVTTTRQYQDLAAATPERRREMVTAWLGLAGIDPGTVRSVRLERTVRTLPAGADEWIERSRETVVDVMP
ncbi:hypothetical protein [Oerskovia enterophila]|uniref:Uncharacterized protein n=1 Tax=Oerskovia enterophila TaxID=43678 RepID=A0ABX2Y0C4_9CELL|nr:hypothetical protein [Oerskovia enterophila]OCI29586.1 hypothetical protein OERS_37400 [Oerskovia enterophila]